MKFMKYPSLRHGHMSKGLMLLAQMTSALLVLEVTSMPWNTHPCVITHIFNVSFATQQVSYSKEINISVCINSDRYQFSAGF